MTPEEIVAHIEGPDWMTAQLAAAFGCGADAALAALREAGYRIVRQRRGKFCGPGGAYPWFDVEDDAQ